MSLTIFRTVGLTAAIALGAVACAGDGSTETASTDGVATLETESGSPAAVDETQADASANTAEAPDDPELAFGLYDECMADAGFDFGATFFSDGDSEDGGIIVDDVTLDDSDPQTQNFADPEAFDEEFTAADEECQKHLANIDNQFDLDPEQQAQFEDAEIAWAECMRDKGIAIPDVDTGGDGIAIQIGPEIDPDDPQSSELDDADFDFAAFEDAAKECESVFDELNELFAENEEEGS